MDFINGLVVLMNFVLIPATAYGAQLALGALGVTLIYGILRFSNFAHGDTMACLLYTSPSPRDLSTSRMPSSA